MALDAVVTIVASLAQLAFITRNYPADFVGDYQLCQAALFIIWAISCAGGISMIVSRELSTSEPDRRTSILSNALVLQGIISVLISLSLYSTVAATSSDNFKVALAIALGSGVTLIASLLQISQALLVSAEKIPLIAAVSILANLITTLVVLAASCTTVPLPVLVIATILAQLLRGVCFTVLARGWRYVSLSCVNRLEIIRIFKEALPVLVMIVATHLYVRVDVLMLNYWTDHQTVARYGSAYAFLDQLMILSNFMMSALFPNFAKASLDMRREYRVLYRGILLLFAKYLLPIAGCIAIFSSSLLTGLYGPEYSQAGVALSVLMLAAIFAWINGPAGTIFITLQRQSLNMWATIVGLVVNIVGNAILIPLVGAVGSAIATVFTEVALCCVCLWWIYRLTKWLPWMPLDRSGCNLKEQSDFEAQIERGYDSLKSGDP